ncbi:MAG TPA: hypothetical protein VN688_21595 [Gemmataceae bacterium]|nr:hypothetical protein [Gemmataceae bacterium]
MQSKRPDLTIEQILAWAESYLQRIGQRPNGHSGMIPESSGETWAAIDSALTHNYRGLRLGLSLAELLNRYWGEKPLSEKPPLTIEQILAWARTYYRRTGKWPTAASGAVTEAPEETWKRINAALWEGFRGFSGGSSLSQLLRHHLGGRMLANGNGIMQIDEPRERENPADEDRRTTPGGR